MPNTAPLTPVHDSTRGVFNAVPDGALDANRSGVSWAAIFAGATAAAALSLILLVLGFGLGLSSVSPWANNDWSTIGIAAVAWIAFTQLAASGIGGYLSGRLRVKWASVHTDEVYFRDTAHGLLSWAVASLLTVALVGGGAASLVKGVAGAGSAAAVATGVAAGPAIQRDAPHIGNPVDYFSDQLLRSDKVAETNPEARIEVSRIFVTDLAAGSLPANDRAYLAQHVAQRTGLNKAEAEQRVDAVFANAIRARDEAKAAADAARKAAAHTALWLFAALLFGAFVASITATIGGRQRDRLSPLPTL
ncbi:hypothetical protein IGB42_02388 [Andreprevotia sp. IGB-42]|uniref:hypothetical protein n=1 Tax=Andreprevotia sp. IGB-42 TaxID=2497473 RepID=UPI00157EAF47|nr:hypothetical protein [Andreprevotia sp. IGB-42]KAF0812992.1 hypothetical protein IGB42_02388 [Andreprevotia sp. IGB-42]